MSVTHCIILFSVLFLALLCMSACCVLSEAAADMTSTKDAAILFCKTVVIGCLLLLATFLVFWFMIGVFPG